MLTDSIDSSSPNLTRIAFSPLCFLQAEDNRYLGKIVCDVEREHKISFYSVISTVYLMKARPHSWHWKAFACLSPPCLLVYSETLHSNQNTQSHWLKREFLYWDIPDCSRFFPVSILHLPPGESYRKRVGKRGVQLKFSNAGKLLMNVWFPVVNRHKDTQKTSDKHWIYLLGKTTVKAYENEMLNGSFLMRENC